MSVIELQDVTRVYRIGEVETRALRGVGSIEEAERRLLDLIGQTAAHGGKVVIPAFAVGRTQLLMYYLRQLEDWDRIPNLPVYVDSPLAINATEVFRTSQINLGIGFATALTFTLPTTLSGGTLTGAGSVTARWKRPKNRSAR